MGNVQNRNAVVITDEAGEIVPSWQVPLDQYLEAHEGQAGDWTGAHRIVVARAVIHGQPVPEAIIAEHDPLLYEADLLRERRFHEQAKGQCNICRLSRSHTAELFD